MFNFKTLRINYCSCDPKKLPIMPLDLFYGEISFTKTQGLIFICQKFYGRYPKDSKFPNSEFVFFPGPQ
jgi:hypothetical protein